MRNALLLALCWLIGLSASLAAPVVVADAVTMHAGQKAAIAVLANDSGDIDANTVVIVTPPQFGTAVPTGAGRVLYTHTTGTPATDSFAYRVSGGGGLSAPATVTITFATGLRIPGHALNVPATPPATTYQLTPAFGALAFNKPVCLRTPPSETSRLFVCEKEGLLRVIPEVTATAPTAPTFLNLPADVLAPRGELLYSRGECGLLSVAFHPNYAVNRQFFVFYSVVKGGAWSPTGVAGQTFGAVDFKYTGVGAPVRTLTVGSVNPGGGVTLGVSPNDSNGSGAGTTTFTRVYANGSMVNLTAPGTAGGNPFLKWQRDGVDFGVTPGISVTMDGDHTLTAVYGTEGTATAYVTGRVLGTLRNNYTGYVGMKVAVGASPVTVTALGRIFASGNSGTHVVKLINAANGSDVAGGSVAVAMSGGTAGQFKYAALNSPVVLAAGAAYYLVTQESAGGDQWYDSNTTVTTTGAASELSAVYGAGGGAWNMVGALGQTYGPVDFKYTGVGAPVRTLTVGSVNPGIGVSVAVSPNDRNGAGAGTTAFTRVYDHGSVVNLTAPAAAGGNPFLKWQRDGVDFGATPGISVTMDGEHTLTAMYGAEGAETTYVTGKVLGTLRNNYTGYVGMKVAVGASPVTVTALGRIFASGNSGTHVVKLINAADGSEVAGGSVSVAMSGGTAGQFKYAVLSSPVVLAARGTYYLVTQESAGGDQWYDSNTTVTTTGVAAELSAVYGSGEAGLYQRVSRFLTQAGNPNAADIASERVLIEQAHELSNHNAGDMHFGPDGFLYISLGDEGSHTDAYNNSQRIDKDFHSAILRIDVDRSSPIEPNAHPNPTPFTGSVPAVNAIPRYETAPGSGVFRAAYSIPADNPFVGVTTFNGAAVNPTYVRSEIWATGLRNPWRFSIDPATGKLWCGDVGGSAFEEVNLITRGGNYGWAYREGLIDGPKGAAAPGNFDTYQVPPLYRYAHGSGTNEGDAIMGGFVYHGTRFPALQGLYVFADYVAGHVWAIQQDGSGVQRLAGEGGIVALGPDPSNGDVLFADYDENRILRLVSGTTNSFPQTLSETGLFADLTDLAPSPGVLPYAVNLPFWSDHAQKRRWLVIPDTISSMTWSRDGLWTFPSGQVWVKHFDLPLTRSNPPGPSDPPLPARRIETRLLVKNAGGAYGVSYRWNDAGTEAVLVPDGGAEFDVAVTQNGAPYAQRWHIPSRSACLICHTPQAGYALSANTRQLNLANNINGFAGNQLDLLRSAGYFSNTVEPPNVLPRHLRPEETGFPVEARARSYFAVNCSHCHRAGGTAGTALWDGRPELTLQQTGLINGAASDSGGNSANKLVVPGDAIHSIVLSRIAVTNGFNRMPPLGSSELDQKSIGLLTEWIGSAALLNRQTYADWRLAHFFSGSSPEGEPSFDADGDGRTNREEFLALTNPKDGVDFLQPHLAPGGPGLTLGFTLPANRSWQIETSADLAAWSLWNFSGNGGLPHPGGPVTITAPLTGPKSFFRLRLWEN